MREEVAEEAEGGEEAEMKRKRNESRDYRLRKGFKQRFVFPQEIFRVC